MKKPTILFAHLSGEGGQFFSVCEYLQKEGLANTYFLGGANSFGDAFDPKRHFIFEPDGNITNPSYYYSWYAEIATRISLGILNKVREIQKEISLDIIIGHYIYGSANLLYDEINVPIITYLEFPSFRHHKWDTQYPPTQYQLLNDKAHEMVSNYHLLKSDITIVPSYYVKKMLPKLFQHKVTVIPDAISNTIHNPTKSIISTSEKLSIGFYARTLSSEKGFEQFIKISKALLEKDPGFHFVIIGASEGISYGYDKQYAETLGFKNFKDLILARYPIDQRKYTFYELLDYENYNSLIYSTDIFLYPLLYGSGTWGFFELFLRGKPIIASNRCFLPEVISHGENGILCDYENVDAWVEAILDLKNNPEKRKKIAHGAQLSAKKYSDEKIAKKYLKIVQKVIGERC